MRSKWTTRSSLIVMHASLEEEKDPLELSNLKETCIYAALLAGNLTTGKLPGSNP